MKLWAVAQYTIKDLIRSKIMWNIPVLGVILALITYVASEFTFGVPERVATNFGLAALTLSAYGIAFFAGVMLIRTEAESRTVYLIISRPLSRETFLIGKILGVSTFLAINVVALALVCFGILMTLGAVLNTQVVVATGFVLLESILLLVMIVLLSMVSNVALTLIFGVLLLVAGHAVGVTQEIMLVKKIPALATSLKYYHWVLPAFYKLNFKNYAVYAYSFPWQTLGSALVYWLSYTTGLLLLGCAVIRRKDFD